MIIKRIKVSNYKTYLNLDLDLSVAPDKPAHDDSPYWCFCRYAANISVVGETAKTHVYENAQHFTRRTFLAMYDSMSPFKTVLRILRF